jgi:hypothetical protein
MEDDRRGGLYGTYRWGRYDLDRAAACIPIWRDGKQ